MRLKSLSSAVAKGSGRCWQLGMSSRRIINSGRQRIDGMSKLMMQVACEGDLCILQQEVNLLEVDSMERRVLQKVVTCLEYYVALKNTTVMPVMKQATNALLACMRA